MTTAMKSGCGHHSLSSASTVVAHDHPIYRCSHYLFGWVADFRVPSLDPAFKSSSERRLDCSPGGGLHGRRAASLTECSD